MPRVLALALSCWLVLAPVLAGEATPAPEVMVYAATSLRDALQAIAPACDKSASVRLVFNFGASNDLARQIVTAHKADLFVSADEAWMGHVAEHGLLDAASRRTLLSNRLVLIVPLEAPASIAQPADLAGPAVTHLSLADPAAVPAGKYARAWLESLKLWHGVKDKVVPAFDVRAALAAVESGVAEAGIVYRTDTALSKKVKVAYEVPERAGPTITYPAAALEDRPAHDAALRALECFSGKDAAAVFERFGFVVVRR